MLAKIENVYLAILRIVVLVVATIALIAAGFGLVTSLPALGAMLSLSEPEKAAGGSLAQYIALKKDTVPNEVDEAGERSTITRKTIPGDVREAAKAFQNYTSGLEKADEVKLADWEDGIMGIGERMPFTLQAPFYADTLDLSAQLGTSTGEKLSVAQVEELVLWNAEEFATSARTNSYTFSRERMEGRDRLTWAAGAFLIFLLVIFTFLFVKVERSLRLVRTVREEDVICHEELIDED